MQKSKNKAAILIVFIILLIGAIVLTVLKVNSVAEANKDKTSSRYETIMKFDFVNNYPTTPNKVMDDYCYIVSYLYSDEIKEEEIPDVVAKSRELMHFKILENNGLESHIQGAKNERAIIAETNSYVTNTTHSTVNIDKQFPNYADCTITQYTKSGNNLIGEYVLQMDNYQWKVYTWSLKGTSVQNGK